MKAEFSVPPNMGGFLAPKKMKFVSGIRGHTYT